MRPLLLALLLLSACITPADYVFVNGRIHTLDAERPVVDTVVLRGDRIAAVGPRRVSDPHIGRFTVVVDLEGRAVYPGFADAHLHLASLGLALSRVDLVGTTTYAEVVERAAARAGDTPAGGWVLGRGWDQNDWEDTDFPHHQDLSAATPDHPVLLTRIDGHAVLANAEAMARAGITAGTADPPGGAILRDAGGQPTGVFVDNATALLERIVPAPTHDELRDATARAIARLHSHGITSVHDAGVSAAELDVFAEMAREGHFPLRNHVMVTPEAYHRSEGGDDERARRRWLTAVHDVTGQGLIAKRAIKAYADGALGSRGAELLEPYSDDPGNTGLAVTDPADIRSLAAEALRGGMQLCVHAIGDKGNRDVLDAFDGALAEVPPHRRWSTLRPEHRFRVEHAQVLHPDDIGRFAELGVIPSMQALHLTSDMPWAGDRLGPERVQGAYAWRSLLDTGVIIPGGSDAPVERPDALAAYRAAVTRTDANGEPPGGWQPQQAMTRSEALLHLTLWPAVASFQEHRLGRLAPGFMADMVVLSDDITIASVEAMGDITVDLTVFAGEIVYEREEAGPLRLIQGDPERPPLP